MQNSKAKPAQTESIHSDRHTQIKLIASSEHSRRVFSFSRGLNAVQLARFYMNCPPLLLTPLQQLWWVDKGTWDYRIQPFNKYQFKSTLTLLFFFFFNSVVFCGAVTQSLPLTFLPLLFSPASRRVSLSLYCFRNFPPFEFWFLPSACAFYRLF